MGSNTYVQAQDMRCLHESAYPDLGTNCREELGGRQRTLDTIGNACYH
jgi:hypothetical protein